MAEQSYRAYFHVWYCRWKHSWCWKEKEFSKLSFDPRSDVTRGEGYASRSEAWGGVTDELELRQTRSLEGTAGDDIRAAN